jgi:hypothetical protein
MCRKEIIPYILLHEREGERETETENQKRVTFDQQDSCVQRAFEPARRCSGQSSSDLHTFI